MAPEPVDSTVDREPFTRLQAQEYMNKHYPQTSSQNYKYVKETLDFYKQQKPTLSDGILWKWFQASFGLWSLRTFENLAPGMQELRAYLRCGGVYVRPNKGYSIGQTLYEVANEGE